jgi:hypothetical protein
MDDNSPKLDLQLWLNKELFQSQNRLKAGFWELFSQIGNEIDVAILAEIHSKSKGIKLSKGGDLLGFPYHVLDLIRDFDPDRGLNIRILNWFGQGIYLFVHFGKNHPLSAEDYFFQNSFFYALSSSPWDYPDLILKELKTTSPTAAELDSMKFHQYFKKINIESQSSNPKNMILEELKNLLEFFLLKME